MGSGPGLYVVGAICPDCYQEVEMRVLVGSDAQTVVSGSEEHELVCAKRK